ncbi:TPA: ABC transporter permease [Streptococcus equi subsp. ruminatorum]|nr:ABC transporter permease [Streptococcus equi subsp. ruminatorum]
MFGKLLKYEFRSIGKWYFALNAGVIAIAIILSFTIHTLTSNPDEVGLTTSLANKMVPLTLSLTFGSLIAGSFLSTLLIIINRFNKNVFGREGYLTLTLPVTAHQIILSKLLASFVCSIFNGINLLIGIFILIAPTVDFTYLLKVLKTIIKPENLVENTSILIYMLLSTITSILLIYLAVSIGQLFSNRRGLMAFCAYFILVIIIIVVMTYLNDAFFTVNSNSSDSLLYFGDNTAISILNIEQLIEGIILYVATHFIIKNKLNIQ